MKFRGHLCNENAKWRGTKKIQTGSPFWAGRYFLYKNNVDIFRIEWYFLNKAISSLSLGIEFGSGGSSNGITFHIAVPHLFSIWISFYEIFGKIFRYPNESRQTKISFHHGTFYFYPFCRINSWNSIDNWYSKDYTFNFSDFFLGKNKYFESDSTEWKDVVIPMPEKSYKGKLRLYVGNWKNRFGTKRINRADLEMEEGIPFPGKGESEWDCGEDCTFGLTCCADNPENAIAHMIESVLYRRRVYGSYKSMISYTPKEKHIRKDPVQSINGEMECAQTS